MQALGWKLDYGRAYLEATRWFTTLKIIMLYVFCNILLNLFSLQILLCFSKKFTTLKIIMLYVFCNILLSLFSLQILLCQVF